MFEPSWHCSVGYTITGKDGIYCGYAGRSMPVESQEDGWSKGLEWLRSYQKDRYSFLIHSFHIEVKHY